jgi:hypothetical protein
MLKNIFLLMVLLFQFNFAANILDSLKPGEWYEVPNSKLSSVAPSPTPPGTNAKNAESVMMAWSGGSYDTKRDQLIVWGGGHGNYSGNEIYVFNINTLKWTRVNNPSVDVGGNEGSGVYPDGNPRSRHTYNYVQYVPSIDRFCSLGGAAQYLASKGTNKVHCFDFDKKVWELKNNIAPNAYLGNISGYDSKTGLIWMEGAGEVSYLTSWNPITDIWTKHAYYDPTWFQYDYTGVIGNSHFVAIGRNKVYDWDLNTPSSQVKELSTTGGSDILAKRCPGFTFHSPSGNYIAWSGGSDVFSFNLATKTFTKIPLASTNKVTPTEMEYNGTYGRFQYIASKDAFVAVNRTTESVYIFKMGNAKPPSPPDTTITEIPKDTTKCVSDTIVKTVHDTVLTTTIVKDTIIISKLGHDTVKTIITIKDTTKSTIYIKEFLKLTPKFFFDTTITKDTTTYYTPGNKDTAIVVINPPIIIDTIPVVVVPPIDTPPVVVLPVVTDKRLITFLKVKNVVGTSQKNIPVSYGQILKSGDVKLNETIKAFVNDKEIPSQFDLKAVNDDNSIRHGVMSLVIDSLNNNEEITIQIMAVPKVTNTSYITKEQLPSNLDAKLTVKVNGVNYDVSLKDILNNSSMKWLSGNIVNEFIVSSPLKDSLARSDSHLNAIFSVRQYEKNVRIDLTLENCWTYEPDPTGYVYDINYTVGNKTIISQTGVKQPPYTRWRKVAWFENDVKTTIVQDKKYAIRTGAFPYYDITINVPDATLNSFPTSFSLMSNGNIESYMPSTGAADGIAPVPRWAALYLVTMDDRVRLNTIANGEAAGVYSIHFKDKNTNLPVTIDNYPYISVLNGNVSDTYNPATKKEEFPPIPTSNLSPHTPDDAHQPSLAYVPYIVTGDYFFLEELQYWANWNMILENPHYRNYGQGLLDHMQVRARAWGLRTLAQVAYITPNSHPLNKYFVSKLNNNLNFLSNMLKSNTLGYFDVYENPYPPYGIAPWQDHFLTFSLGYAHQLGFTSIKSYLDYKTKFPISLLADSSFCWLHSSTYTLQVANSSGVPYTNIGDLYKGNFPTSTCSGLIMNGYPEVSTGYGANSQPALAISVDLNAPNALKAWKKYETRNPKQKDYNSSPQFNVIPKVVLDSLIK